VKGRRANLVRTWYVEPGELFAEIARSSTGKGHCEDASRDHTVLQEACDPPHHRKGLPRAWAGKYVENPPRIGGNIAVRPCESVVPCRHSAAFEPRFGAKTRR
jgi:hypothetical protein